ncbi:MAG: DUF2917 domain-containing protein [Proteobacteria bacterium]|nr:DUF2917 domain-containing protein [Pseudomonadota bacterium]
MQLNADTTFTLPAGEVLQTSLAGQVEALEGTIWLTVSGQAEDWVLQPGQRLQLPAGARAFVSPWRPRQAARLAWRSLRHAALAGVVAA